MRTLVRSPSPPSPVAVRAARHAPRRDGTPDAQRAPWARTCGHVSPAPLTPCLSLPPPPAEGRPGLAGSGPGHRADGQAMTGLSVAQVGSGLILTWLSARPGGIGRAPRRERCRAGPWSSWTLFRQSSVGGPDPLRKGPSRGLLELAPLASYPACAPAAVEGTRGAG
eukprot:scaffold1269_cov400-Prasinococcus_capsulatus_cf.AAC.9